MHLKISFIVKIAHINQVIYNQMNQYSNILYSLWQYQQKHDLINKFAFYHHHNNVNAIFSVPDNWHNTRYEVIFSVSNQVAVS